MRCYLISTFAPTSSSFFFIASESALLTASLTFCGTPSTRSFASFRPSPVSSRTTLITLTFLSAGYSFRITVNSVFSSTGAAAAAAAPGAAAIATGAAAVTPNFFSMSEISSTTSRTVILEMESRISSLDTAMWGLQIRFQDNSISTARGGLFLVAYGGERSCQFRQRLVEGADELLDGRPHDAKQHRDRLGTCRQGRQLLEVLAGQHGAAQGHMSRDELVIALRKVLHHARGRARIVLREGQHQRALEH